MGPKSRNVSIVEIKFKLLNVVHVYGSENELWHTQTHKHSDKDIIIVGIG